MNTKILLAPALALCTLGTTACAENYATEGGVAGAVAGAGLAAVTGGDIATFALAGAAAGALAGYFVDRDKSCNGYDRNGYLDDDCFGTQGYPVDPR